MDQMISKLQKEQLISYLEFSLELYKNSLPGESRNFVFCPFSIFTVLTMTGLGANSNTLEQFGKILRLSTEQMEFAIHPLLSSLQQHLLAMKRNQVNMATALVVQKDYVVLSKFQSNLERFYQTKIFTADFVSNLRKAIKEVNDWFAHETNDKIGNMVNDEILDVETRLLLLSAVYLKGKWEKKFSERNTRNEIFHLLNGVTEKIPIMNQQLNLMHGWYKDLECSVVEIPYIEKEMSMVILLPDTNDGLPKLEASITAKNLQDLNSTLTMKKINLKLPRFQMENSVSLKDSLIRMGLMDAFVEKADFTRISEKNDLCLSSVEHKATIEVDEEGTVAAAATVVAARNKRSAEFVIDFVADHPFFFYVRDNLSGFPLFIGRFTAQINQNQQKKDEL